MAVPSVPPIRQDGLAPRYAPVAALSVTLVHGSAGAVVEGWAAPASGRLPCAVQLAAGPCLVALATATRFSAAAAGLGQRFGWCGVRIGAMDAAAALDDEVRLLCAASGAVLMRWTAAEILLGPSRTVPAQTRFLTVPELSQVLHRATACEDAGTAAPFADHLLHSEGRRAMVLASYRWILRRTPALAEADGFAEGLSGFDPVGRCFDMMLGSQEYLASPHLLVGPFDVRFPFGLDAFDDSGNRKPPPAPPP